MAAIVSGKMRQIWRIAKQSEVISSSIKIAVIVGTVLNIINQGEYVMHGHDISLSHIILNYFVPYLVSTTSAVMTRLRDAEQCQILVEDETLKKSHAAK